MSDLSQNEYISTSDVDSATLTHYISMVSYLIRALLRKVEDLEQKCHSDESSTALLTILRRLLARLFEELHAQASPATLAERRYAMRYARTVYVPVTELLPQFIEAIRAANRESRLAPIVEAYASIINQISYGTNVICYPIWEHNAGYREVRASLTDLVEEILGPGSGIFTWTSKYCVMLTYPIGQEDMVLEQALMAHEIGHFLNRHARPWSRSYIEEGGQAFDPEDTNRFLSMILAGVPAEQRDVIKTAAVTQLNDILKNWLEELAADLFAVCLMGPAYLFAFDEMTFGAPRNGVVKIVSTHPPRNLRVREVARLIQALQMKPASRNEVLEGLTEKERSVLAAVGEWVYKVSYSVGNGHPVFQRQGQLSSETIKTMYQALKTALERASKSFLETEVPEINSNLWYCGPRDIVDAAKLYSLLEHDLTPSELIGSPERGPSFSAVMNAGWFHYLVETGDYAYFQRKRDKQEQPGEVDQRYMTLQGLAAKAIEILLFKQEYRRQQGMQAYAH